MEDKKLSNSENNCEINTKDRKIRTVPKGAVFFYKKNNLKKFLYIIFDDNF